MCQFWLDKNQKDIKWYKASKQSDGSYVVHMNIAKNIEKLKKLLSKQAKEQGKFNEMASSLIKACRTREDIEMVANNLKIELNLELF